MREPQMDWASAHVGLCNELACPNVEMPRELFQERHSAYDHNFDFR
jgi:hypothetical protein